MNKDNLIRISTLLSQDTIDQVKQEAARNSIKPATLMRQIIVKHFEGAPVFRIKGKDLVASVERPKGDDYV